MKKIVIWLGIGAVLIGLVLFFSHRILISPLGLLADEAAIGLNASLLSKTGRDENGWRLPVFVLTLNGTDWKQPVNIYYTALLFKIFGSSVFILRFAMVLIAVISVILMFILAWQMKGRAFALLATALFMTTPLVMIQSHLAMENIMVLPFTLLWILGVYMFSQTKSSSYLVGAGIALGICFYTYKGMRATVPVWALLTWIYLSVDWIRKPNKESFRAFLRQAFFFGLGLFPFMAIAPILERKYPGAVFDGKGLKWDSWYDFLHPYFSSFDLSFLYITGDITPYHSAGKYGMMLLASAPLFFIGLFEAIKRKRFWIWLALVFFSAPLLFGFVDSVHRASRLMSMIPPYALLSALGAIWIWEKKRVVLLVMLLVAALNYIDFVQFYWYKYPEITRQWFGDLSQYKDFELFGRQAKLLNLDPYIESDIGHGKDPSRQFFQSAYVDESVRYLMPGEQLPEGGILLSQRDQIPGLKKLSLPTVLYKIQVLQ